MVCFGIFFFLHLSDRFPLYYPLRSWYFDWLLVYLGICRVSLSTDLIIYVIHGFLCRNCLFCFCSLVAVFIWRSNKIKKLCYHCVPSKAFILISLKDLKNSENVFLFLPEIILW